MLASEVWRPSLTWRVWVYSARGAIEAEVAGMAPPTPSGLMDQEQEQQLLVLKLDLGIKGVLIRASSPTPYYLDDYTVFFADKMVLLLQITLLYSQYEKLSFLLVSKDGQERFTSL
ncbi:hypothetical protein HanIR_Chr11g0503161 [Helianthus annuus]|nr:hypothetical protein HanIR_Chr11g0503161 [Helianthus annuus]